jgi:hypothetical protein
VSAHLLRGKGSGVRISPLRPVLGSLWKALRPGLRPKKQGRWVPEQYADVPVDYTYVVCGFYTPDYHRWLKLIESLINWGTLTTSCGFQKLAVAGKPTP